MGIAHKVLSLRLVIETCFHKIALRDFMFVLTIDIHRGFFKEFIHGDTFIQRPFMETFLWTDHRDSWISFIEFFYYNRS